jgi:DNA polymerase III delta prime subunit
MMGYTQTLKINPPTDKEIEKVLHQICNKEGANSSNIALNKF